MNTQLLRSFLIFSCGFSPIASLSLSLFGVSSLPFSTGIFVIPAMMMLLYSSLNSKVIAKKILHGFIAGVLACAIYDITRLGFVYLGFWDDFVLRIGDLLLNQNGSHPIYGYTWRLIGNGGGMGIAFAFIPILATKKSGTYYGIAIWFALIFTLLFSLHGQEMLFQLNAKTLLASLIGHLEYGSILGLLLAPKTLPTIKLKIHLLANECCWHLRRLKYSKRYLYLRNL